MGPLMDTYDDTQDRADYDVFISYSHVKDDSTAASLHRALQGVAKPWYKPRGMRVFRDETDLTFAPDGWQAILSALSSSRYFLLLASERAAQSEWVEKEVQYWLENRPADRLLIALMNGAVVWDSEAGRFDWTRTTSLPRILDGVHSSEPFWVDLRWTTEAQMATLRNPEYTTAVAKLAAPIRDLDVAELVSEDYKQHRRTRRIAYSAGGTLAAAIGVALWQFQASLVAAERQLDQTVLTSVSSAYQSMYLDPLRALDHANAALSLKSTDPGREALCLAIDVGMGRLKANLEDAQVLGSGVGYLMGRWRQGGVFSRVRADGRYALVATERGKDGPNPPGTVYLVSMNDMRTVELVAGKKAHNRRLEYMGFSSSGNEIFVARQFYLDIYDLDGNRTNSVQLEYHAKPTHLIGGMFGKYVLVGDTLGHVMLADTESGDRPQLNGSGSSRVAALFISENRDGTRAVVVFEDGGASLANLATPEEPTERRLSDEGVTHAAFGIAGGEEILMLGKADGRVELWKLTNDQATLGRSFQHGDSAVRLISQSEDLGRVISLSEDGIFRVWTVSDQSEIATFSAANLSMTCGSRADG